MEIKGISELKNALELHNGKDAVISISHKLYGDQKIKCKLNFFADEKRVGIRIKSGQELYVRKDGLYVDVIDDHILLADDMVCMNIGIA